MLAAGFPVVSDGFHALGVVVVRGKTVLVVVALTLSVAVTVGAGAANADRNGAVDWGKLKTGVHWSRGIDGPERAKQVLETPAAKRVLSHCRRLGMRELPEETFAIPVSRCSGESGYVVVPMRHPAGDRFASALLFREGNETAVAITVDTSTGELVQAISPGGEEVLVSFDKKKWSDCFAVSCSVCIAGCVFTGPLWLKCMGACCGVSAATCAVISLQE